MYEELHAKIRKALELSRDARVPCELKWTESNYILEWMDCVSDEMEKLRLSFGYFLMHYGEEGASEYAKDVMKYLDAMKSTIVNEGK